MDITAFWLTLRLAALTTLALLVIGLPLAWWLATSRRRWTLVVETLVTLPLILPPTVAGFYFLMATGPGTPAGKFLLNQFGTTLPFTFHGILIALIVSNLPFAVRPFIASFSGVDRRLLEASWCLGEGKLATWARIALPLSWPGILAGTILSFAHCIGEFGVVLMVGGNIPGVTRTLSIAIYDDVQALEYESAARTAMVLVLFSFTVLCIVHWLQRVERGR